MRFSSLFPSASSQRVIPALLGAMRLPITAGRHSLIIARQSSYFSIPRSSTLLAGFIAVLSCSSARAEAPATITVDPAETRGVWEGWGTSLAWFGKVFGDRDDLADVLFTTKRVELTGEPLPGLGMNIVRYNAGACGWNEIDGRRMVVSKTILPFRQIEGFWLDGKNPNPDSDSWDWSVDANQRALLLKAKERGVDHFELFSNSPMWWMTKNDNPSGNADNHTDNLPPENYGAFATYLATIAARAKSHWGVTFTSIDPFNEPISANWFADCKQEGAQFNVPGQIAFLPVLRAELDRQGLKDLPIVASDETSYDQALKAWRGYPPEARALVARFNVHGYQGPAGDRAGLRREVAVEAGKPIWNSEHGDKHASGLEMARNLHRDMAVLRPLAWCYWQPLDGGNNGGWGFIAADMEKGRILRANPKYFVFAQYSRHIRPGMTILGSNESNTIVACDARARRLVLATLNDGPARTVCYDLSRFRGSSDRVQRFVTEMDGGARYAELPEAQISDGRLTISFPANSVQTLILSDITPH